MKKNIQYLSLKLIKNVSLLMFIISCVANNSTNISNFVLETKDGAKISLELAIKSEDQTKGLSGRKPDQFRHDQGMLFAYPDIDFRTFWMPDTYFNLDIFYLTKDFIVINVDRDVQFHPGYTEPPVITRLPPTQAQHVLEMRSDSKIAKDIKIGDQLIWKSASSLEEILSKTHQRQ